MFLANNQTDLQKPNTSLLEAPLDVSTPRMKIKDTSAASIRNCAEFLGGLPKAAAIETNEDFADVLADVTELQQTTVIEK